MSDPSQRGKTEPPSMFERQPVTSCQCACSLEYTLLTKFCLVWPCLPGWWSPATPNLFLTGGLGVLHPNTTQLPTVLPTLAVQKSNLSSPTAMVSFWLGPLELIHTSQLSRKSNTNLSHSSVREISSDTETFLQPSEGLHSATFSQVGDAKTPFHSTEEINFSLCRSPYACECQYGPPSAAASMVNIS